MRRWQLLGMTSSPPGEWCGFCKLAPTCRTRAEVNLALAQHEFVPPAELTDAETAQVVAQLPDLKAWAADVEAHPLSLAVNQGKTCSGFKFVEGRSISKCLDKSPVAQAAEAAGVDAWHRKRKTITALKKQPGKKRFTTLLGDLVVKPAGKPTLVPNSDKRPALESKSTADEFTAIK